MYIPPPRDSKRSEPWTPRDPADKGQSPDARKANDVATEALQKTEPPREKPPLPPRKIVAQPPVQANPEQTRGPADGLLQKIPLDLYNPILNYVEKPYPSSVTGCIELMKVFWHAPSNAKPSEVIFGTIDINKFARWINTHKIRKENFKISDEDLKNLLPLLDYVDIDCDQIRKSNIFAKENPFTLFKNAKHVRASYLTDTEFLMFAKFEQLEALDLDYCINLTDHGLKEAFANDSGRSSDGYFLKLKSFGFDPKVDYLRFSSEIYKYLPKELEIIHLNNFQANAGFLQDLEQFEKITALDCRGFYRQEADYQTFPNLTSLTSLDFGGCNITSKGLQYLKGLANLQFLDLAGTYVGSAIIGRNPAEAGFEELIALSNLETIHLGGCARLVDSDLDHLCNLPKLKKIYLRECHSLTLEGITSLRKKMPEVHIDTGHTWYR